MNEISSIRAGFHNIEAEQQVLGAMLLNNDLAHRVGDFLGLEHFFDPVHARIYDLIQRRVAAGHVASPVTLKSIMENDEGLKQLGGPAYLARMAGAAISSSMIRDYAAVVVADAARRALNTAAAEAGERLVEGVAPSEVASGLLRAIQSLPEAHGSESSFSLMSAMTEAAQRAVEAYQGNVSFLKTGLPPLDKIVRGLAPGDFCIVAGATSMGKTSLALEITKNVATAGKGVAFVSLEMTRHELATRLASQASRIAYSALRDPSGMDEDDFRKWVTATPEVGKLPIRIIPRHIRDIPAIFSAVKRAQVEQKDLGLVVVDYAQLVRAPGKSRTEQMVEVSIGLKQLAGMLEIPLIGLCQLSRDIGSRDDKRPQLSDIKETGQFENDADQVVFCHRESYWLERQGPRPDKSGKITDTAIIDWKADCAAVKNKMELIVRKNRHGKLATAEVGFHDATMRFWEMGKHESREPE